MSALTREQMIAALEVAWGESYLGEGGKVALGRLLDALREQAAPERLVCKKCGCDWGNHDWRVCEAEPGRVKCWQCGTEIGSCPAHVKPEAAPEKDCIVDGCRWHPKPDDLPTREDWEHITAVRWVHLTDTRKATYDRLVRFSAQMASGKLVAHSKDGFACYPAHIVGKVVELNAIKADRDRLARELEEARGLLERWENNESTRHNPRVNDTRDFLKRTGGASG